MNAFVVNHDNNLTRVKTNIGDFKGIWCSNYPAEYRLYDLEFACGDVITRELLQYSTISTPFISNIEDSVIVNGLVETIEDNVLFLRLRENIMMLKVFPASAFLQYIGQYARISLSHIQLYDTGVY